jgi:hypothetical protein
VRPHARIVTLGSHRIASTASVTADYARFARISSLIFIRIRNVANELNEMSMYPLRRPVQPFKLDSDGELATPYRFLLHYCSVSTAAGRKHHLSSVAR